MKYIIKIKDFNLSEKLNKSYETIEDTIEDKSPQLEDYVICKDNEETHLNEFLNNNIGVIKDIVEETYPFDVQYENIPKNLSAHFGFGGVKNDRVMSREEILYFSDDKEKLEQIILNNKYNL